MVEENRKFKYGQFGYGKYIYKDEELQNIKKFFRDNITKFLEKIILIILYRELTFC